MTRNLGVERHLHSSMTVTILSEFQFYFKDNQSRFHAHRFQTTPTESSRVLTSALGFDYTLCNIDKNQYVVVEYQHEENIRLL